MRSRSSARPRARRAAAARSLLAALAAGAVGAATTGCAPRRAASGDGAAAAPAAQTTESARPLAEYLAHRVIVLPVQSLRRADSLGWGGRVGEPRDLLAAVDRALIDSLDARGVRKLWALSDVVVQGARRNAAFATDPHALAAAQLRNAANGNREQQLPEPVASQLRTLVGLQDARYALVPLDLRFEGAPGGGRAVLPLVLVDARGSRILLARNVTTAAIPDFSPARIPEVAGAIAGRIADLIAAP